MDEVKQGSPPASASPPETPSSEPPVIPLEHLSIETGGSMFAGPDGLRAGWRLVLYLVMWRLLRVGLGILLEKIDPHVRIKLWLDLITELGSFVIVAVPAVVMGWIEKREFGEYGLPVRRAFGKSFWVGAGWGVVAITALMVGIGGVGDFSLGGFALHGGRVLKFAVFWGVFFLAVGLFEEFLARGYTQFTLTQGIGFWPSALVLSGFFTFLHVGNPGETWVGLLAVAAIGLFLCLTLRRTGNLWLAVGFHMGWDWGQTFFYGVPDSGIVPYHNLLNSTFSGPRWLTGGIVGPEASVITPIALLVVALIFSRFYRENRLERVEPSALPVISA